ncbi:MAG: transglycosylase domain-containing protein [Firmicutes bacterium]|nr:transglycosylase domain-containing protein [Bacillota bacterium]
MRESGGRTPGSLPGGRRNGGRGGRSEGGAGRGGFRRAAWTVLWLALGAVLAVGSGLLLYAEVGPLPGISPAQLMGASATLVYDRNGREVGALPGTANRKPVPLDQIAPSMQQAIVAVEDRNFWTEPPIDPLAVVRALWADIRAGRIVQGGSTITQQLAKNAVVGSQVSLSRKVREALYAIRIARLYSKRQILEFYLNQVYFGHGAYGVEAAAQTYFGKPASQLTLAQSALLAGLVNAPSALDPLVSDPQLRAEHQKLALERRDVVLNAMVRAGAITPAEARAAAAQGFAQMGLASEKQAAVSYPWFLEYVDVELARLSASGELPVSPTLLHTGGYKIYTTLDPGVQQAVESLYQPGHNGSILGALRADRNLDSSTVVLDPRNGAVRAIYGSYQTANPFSQGFVPAWSGAMQPGSAIKPLTVYGPALDVGKLTVVSQVSDASDVVAEGAPVRNYPGDPYLPLVPVSRAIGASFNVSAVWTLQQIGASTASRYAQAFGILSGPGDSQDWNNPRRLALGDLDRGVNLLQMAGAYTAFANGGLRSEPFAVERVVGPEGNVLYQHQLVQKQVVQPSTAYLMTYLLRFPLLPPDGTARGAAAQTGVGPDWPAAGKTGTASRALPSGGTSTGHVWFCGYTPELVGCSWIGLWRPDQGRWPSGITSDSAAQLLLEVFRQMGRPSRGFAVPPNVVVVDGVPFVKGTVPAGFLLGQQNVIQGTVAAVSSLSLTLDTTLGPVDVPLAPGAVAVGPGGSGDVPSLVQVGDSVTVWLSNGQAVLVVDAQGKGSLSLSGTLDALNATQVTLTLAGGGQVTLPLAPDAAVTAQGQPVDPAQVLPGAPAVAQLDASGRVTALDLTLAATPGTSGTIVSLEAGSLVFSPASGGGPEILTLDPQVRVTLDGQPSSLAALRPGMAATLLTDPRSGAVTAIEASSGGPSGAPAGGSATQGATLSGWLVGTSGGELLLWSGGSLQQATLAPGARISFDGLAVSPDQLAAYVGEQATLALDAGGQASRVALSQPPGQLSGAVAGRRGSTLLLQAGQQPVQVDLGASPVVVAGGQLAGLGVLKPGVQVVVDPGVAGASALVVLR